MEPPSLRSRTRPAAKALAKTSSAQEMASLQTGAAPIHPFLHATVNYASYAVPGGPAPTAAQQAMLDHIFNACAVPDNFEGTALGPLSGMAWHLRIIGAYEQGLLAPRAGAKSTASASAASSTRASSAPATPLRLGAKPSSRSVTPLRSMSPALALDLTPAREAHMGAGDDKRRVMCAECGTDGHWRWDCDKRYRA